MEGSSSEKPVVVLGFGTAGATAVLAMREAGYDGAITVITDAGAQPYSPVLTSYYAGGRISREQCFTWTDLDPSFCVDNMYAHSHVTAIDVVAHEIEIDNGRRIGYSKLLIATGARPVSPGFPQECNYHPLVLRTMEDADRLYDALVSPRCKKVLVSGTSMVGLKVLEACLDQNVQATLLGRSQHILRAAAHPLIAERFETLLAERGVALRLGQTITGLTRTSSITSDSDAEANEHAADCTISFNTGENERFDEVVLAQGVKPNLDFISNGLAIDQGLVVDQFMRTSTPDVYAAGDVAQALDVSTGEHRIIGLWQNAVQQGRCAGRAIAVELSGRIPTWAYPGSLPCNTIHVRDILFSSVGSLAEGENRFHEVDETGDAVCVFAYETIGTDRRLVGVNILSVVSAKGGADSIDCIIGEYRRQILNSYLQ